MSTNRNKSMELKASKCIDNLYSNASIFWMGNEKLKEVHSMQ